MKQKTFTPKAQTKAQKKWYIVDAEGQVVGRLATKIADVIRGKHKPTYTAHLDMGDYVVVINAQKAKLTGRKEKQKIYYKHTGYLGHMHETQAWQVRKENPEKLILSAVKTMVPKNKIQRDILAKLFVYAGAEHPHAGQTPEPLTIKM